MVRAENIIGIEISHSDLMRIMGDFEILDDIVEQYRHRIQNITNDDDDIIPQDLEVNLLQYNILNLLNLTPETQAWFSYNKNDGIINSNYYFGIKMPIDPTDRQISSAYRIGVLNRRIFKNEFGFFDLNVNSYAVYPEF